MQNTNTNDPTLSTPSSLAEEKQAAMPAIAVRVKNSDSSIGVVAPKYSLAQKFLMCLSKIFGTKKHKAHAIALAPIPEQKNTIPAQTISARPTFAALHIQQIEPSVTAENIRRKIAEQEFLALDITRATRN